MSDWRKRLTEKLEPVLRKADPRPEISAYHDMPYAIFRYPPEDEFAVRQAECLNSALHAEGLSAEALAEAERSVGTTATIETIHEVLSSYRPLDQIVAERIPGDADPLRDIVFLVRAGALFPVYRTSSLLEQLKGRVHVPSVLFYPGVLDGAAGLRFMGVLDADHNYRPKIF
jgi:hypothetical protein